MIQHTAIQRYLVLPMRPEGTDDLHEFLTRDSASAVDISPYVVVQIAGVGLAALTVSTIIEMEVEMRNLSVFFLQASGIAAICIAVAAAVGATDNVSPIYRVALPEGYRDWKMITVAHEAGKNNDIRAILGNEIAVQAFREGTRPFPDGSVIARLAYVYKSSPENDAVFPAPQSFVAGDPTNVQISVKDSKKYADSGGWGYAQFENGLANQSATLMKSCFACHTMLDRSKDFVFSHYSQ
ncbi:cytochrome P460 family protein [Rhizobium grahamii]|nr:cytochrome P460 family protein [Rhizobium grahamii]